MATAGFQHEDARFASGAIFGTGAFGTAAFGGGDWPIVALPENEQPGDDTGRPLRRRWGGTVHRRHGIVVGRRTWYSGKVWSFVFTGQDVAFMESLRDFFEAKRFRFLPDVTIETAFYRVIWSGDEFHPEPMQATNEYTIRFEIEEAV